jgi:hypothetical protein
LISDQFKEYEDEQTNIGLLHLLGIAEFGTIDLGIRYHGTLLYHKFNGETTLADCLVAEL